MVEGLTMRIQPEPISRLIRGYPFPKAGMYSQSRTHHLQNRA